MELTTILEKWKQNGIFMIGGLLIGAGIADCLFAINHVDLNQIARGLTIFSAGVTILVIMDSNKIQKKTEQVQQDTQLRLKRIEEKLFEFQQSQQLSITQYGEIKELLHKLDSSSSQ